MQLEVFNVEHGACALLTLGDGRLIAIDCGHNSSTGWTLHGHLRTLGTTWLDELWLTNLDQDHLSGLTALIESTSIGNILVNRSITPSWLRAIKREVGVVSRDIETLCGLMDAGLVNLPYAPLPASVGAYYAWNVCGASFHDTNNLSLAAVVSLGSVNVLFPGDLKRAGMKSLLQNAPLFAPCVRDIHVLVAPHHGRDNGCSQDLFDAMYPNRPQLCIMSDGDMRFETQETHDWYRHRVDGVQMRDGVRKILTTRTDGRITLAISADGRGNVTTDREQQQLRVRHFQGDLLSGRPRQSMRF
jgi:beta-lactamase superfamily II metal-dependent hydrolase